MTALTSFLNVADLTRTGHYCPACKDWLTAGDMDLAGNWRHSDAMRARYGAVCCVACTDAHVVTVEGDCIPSADASYSDEMGLWFTTPDAMYDAEAERAEAFGEWQADLLMMRGWQ